MWIRRARAALYCMWLVIGAILAGCNSSPSDLPTQDEIKRQLERDAAVRAEEDRLEASGQS